MSELRATVGNSYRCSAEENLQITDKAYLNVFNVQIQVFKIDGDKFGAGKTFILGGGGKETLRFVKCKQITLKYIIIIISIIFCSQMPACGCYA